MRRGIVRIAGVMGMALGLAGCGLADSHASLPEFMRVRSNDVRPSDPQPDIRKILQDTPNSVFTPESHATGIQISALRRMPNGSGWTVCVRADLTSVVGRPIGTQTYLAMIEHNVVVDRRRSEADDNCTTEAYTPL
jgi:hypothetical protein